MNSIKPALTKTRLLITGLLLLAMGLAGIACLRHPILLKWLTGSARPLGKPLHTLLYRNGRLDKSIKVFHVTEYWNGEPADYYLLYSGHLRHNRLKVLSLNKTDNYAGVSAATNINDYDLVGGTLFQSEVGSKFTPFQHDVKGFNYDPHLRFNQDTISLEIPVNESSKRDSLRIVL